MGLKVLVEALIKHGKTAFALSVSEFGPIGIIDTEQRVQVYARPATVEEAVAKCPWLREATQMEGGVKYPLIDKAGKLRAPFDNPRIMRQDLPAFNAVAATKRWIDAQNVIFLQELLDVQSVGATMERFGMQPALVGQATDTITDLWDQLQELKDPDPKKDRLAWVAPKRLDRRLRWAARTGNGHSVLTWHLKPEYEKRDGELVKVGTIGAGSKETPRWADVHVRLFLPDATDEVPFPAPKMGVIGEGTGGCVKKGTIIEEATFGTLVRLVSYMPKIERSKMQSPGESEYRTSGTMRAIEGAPMVREDKEDPVAPGRQA